MVPPDKRTRWKRQPNGDWTAWLGNSLYAVCRPAPNPYRFRGMIDWENQKRKTAWRVAVQARNSERSDEDAVTVRGCLLSGPVVCGQVRARIWAMAEAKAVGQACCHIVAEHEAARLAP